MRNQGREQVQDKAAGQDKQANGHAYSGICGVCHCFLAFHHTLLLQLPGKGSGLRRLHMFHTCRPIPLRDALRRRQGSSAPPTAPFVKDLDGGGQVVAMRQQPRKGHGAGGVRADAGLAAMRIGAAPDGAEITVVVLVIRATEDRNKKERRIVFGACNLKGKAPTGAAVAHGKDGVASQGKTGEVNVVVGGNICYHCGVSPVTCCAAVQGLIEGSCTAHDQSLYI